MVNFVPVRFIPKRTHRQTPSNVLIRRATPEDVPQMMALERNAATAGHWTEAQYQEIFAGEPVNRVSLVAGEENSLVAFLVSRSVGKEWELENIVVAGSTQRLGLGRRLLEELIQLARLERAESIFLEVRKSNFAAQALYGNLHFVAGGERAAYYSQPTESAVLYRLALTEEPK